VSALGSRIVGFFKCVTTCVISMPRSRERSGVAANRAGHVRVVRLRECEAPNARNAIKVCVECGDPFDLPIQHHGCVNRIARGEAVLNQEIASPICVGKRNGMDVRTNGHEEIVNGARNIEPAQF
jgi:hypothetical protein